MSDLQEVRIGVVVLACVALVAALVWRRWTARLLSDFWNAEVSALNLGLIRIAVAYQISKDSLSVGVARYAKFDPGLRKFPPGWEEIGPKMPLDPESLTAMGWALKISALAATFGIFSRFSMAITCVIGLFVMAVPQFFGKISHYHFLWWFTLILASSRCGDGLSVDALIRTWRAGRPRLVVDPRPSVAYGRPLRMLWIVMGLVYFFPGFWKLWNAGDLWLFGDNFVRLLHAKWMDLAGRFQPLIRVDHYPWLWRPMSIVTVAFESLFVFGLLFPRGRWVFIATGYAFHWGTWYLMRIRFAQLKACYAMFIDVPWVLRTLRLNRVELVDRGLGLSEHDAALTARRQAEPSAGARREGAARTRRVSRKPALLAAVVGLSVIGGVVAAGVQGYDSWPFAVMPRFDRRFPGKRHNYTFRLERNDGTVLDGYDSAYFRSLSDSKYLRQMRRIRRGKKRRKRKKLLALARSIRAAGDRIGPGDELKILQLTRSLSDDDPFAPAPRQRVRAKIVLPESF